MNETWTPADEKVLRDLTARRNKVQQPVFDWCYRALGFEINSKDRPPGASFLPYATGADLARYEAARQLARALLEDASTVVRLLDPVTV